MTAVRSCPGPQQGAVAACLFESWGERAALHDREWRLADLDALVAEAGLPTAVLGVLAFEVRHDLLEIVSCDAHPAGRGTGRALVTAVVQRARELRLARVTVTTTNDNLPALGFYQSCGFTLERVWPDAVAQARRSKPTIPTHGYRGLPIRDELDLVHEL